MSSDNDDPSNNKPPESPSVSPPAAPPVDEDKTIFSPSPLTVPPKAPAKTRTPATPSPETPASAPAPQPVPQAASAPPASGSRPSAVSDPTSFVPMAPRADGDRIQIGDVLNHMFEVKRFIARGGMGEVFEGVNVQSEERVAIKVMLPSLAADPNVQAMFRKEAKTLTKLAHPALVQYRVIAQEPQLGVLYIVTEFVDSKNLEDALTTLNATPAELFALTRRLADGLRVAHSLGAIHRDISPDNILLEDGELAKARIIDFGIAKDLDPSSKTIVGDGFAGKLNFVAPEQLGDFNREVGPWTDVYSLALVILSVAQSRNVNMGGTLVDAVDKRRQGPDLSKAPVEIHPLLTAMLKPNPVERLRSMDEVIAMIDNKAMDATAPAKPAKPVKAPPLPKPVQTPKPPKPVTAGGSPSPAIDPKLLMFGGGAAGLLLIVVLLVVLMGGHHKTKPAQTAEATSAAAPTDQVAAAKTAINAVLPGVDCAWLDVSDIHADGAGVDVSLKGVAHNTIAVQKAISDAMASQNLTLNALNTDDVAPLTEQNACPLLNEYTRIRSKDAPSLSTPQIKWEMAVPATAAKGSPPVAQPIIKLSVDPATPDLAIYGLQPNGGSINLIPNKAGLSNLKNLGNGQYEMDLNQNEKGWAGILVLKGQGPFNDSLVIPDAAKLPAGWQANFESTAGAKGWKTEMIWVNTVDEIPN